TILGVLRSRRKRPAAQTCMEGETAPYLPRPPTRRSRGAKSREPGMRWCKVGPVTRSAGAVAAGDRQTAEAGAQVLREGGSAVDAICAAAFAAFVVEPPLCSPAGAGALLFGDVHHGFHLLDFFACAPGLGLKAPPARLDFHVVDVDFGPTVQQFHVGRGSVAVPGALPGLLEAHRRAGRLPLPEVLAPAIALARHG